MALDGTRTHLSDLSTAAYWNDVYTGRDKAKVAKQRGGHESARFEEVLRVLEGPAVLDVASGYAGFPKFVKTRMPKIQVTAMDFSREAQVRSQWTPYVVGDACLAMPFLDKQFNTVVCCQGLGYMASPAGFLTQARRVGRKLILTVGDRDRTNEDKHTWEFTSESLSALLGQFGKIEMLYPMSSPLIFAKVDMGDSL